MATDKKVKAKSTTKSLKSLASKGLGASAYKHLKYGDFTEADVHEGDVQELTAPTTKGGKGGVKITTDSGSTNRQDYANSIKASSNINTRRAKAFIFQGRLYGFTAPTKSTSKPKGKGNPGASFGESLS